MPLLHYLITFQILIDAPDGNGDTAVITSSVDASGKLSATLLAEVQAITPIQKLR